MLRGAIEVHIGDDAPLVARAGDAIAVPPGVDFRLATAGDEPFEAVACMAAGRQGQVGDGEPFTPPWAA